jgi:guanine nucleotide-binding protein G(I)/G(S)/G(T) subunit beta-1
VHAYVGHAGDVQSIAVYENHFVSGSCDCSAKLWDVRTQDCVRTYSDHDADINSVSISSDGRFLVTGSGDSSCLVYDLRAPGEPLLKLEDEKMARGIESVAFSPRGYHVVTGYENEAVRVWSLVTGQHTVMDAGHQKKIGQVAFSYDGRYLGIASHDQSTSIYSSGVVSS